MCLQPWRGACEEPVSSLVGEHKTRLDSETLDLQCTVSRAAVRAASVLSSAVASACQAHASCKRQSLEVLRFRHSVPRRDGWTDAAGLEPTVPTATTVMQYSSSPLARCACRVVNSHDNSRLRWPFSFCGGHGCGCGGGCWQKQCRTLLCLFYDRGSDQCSRMGAV